ncbi:MAG TPA: DNA internalization-related competence protein ComEC/Rec2 [Bacillota bacterium]|nr:DNA internalization-related competence protein ComEC/Rec2 [Bacillota bacterium]
MAILNLRLPIYNDAEDINSGVVIDIENSKVTVFNKGKYYLYFNESDDLRLGMKIRFQGERIISDQKNVIFGFDYQRFLKANNVLGQYSVKNYELVEQGFVIQMIPDRIKRSFDSNYEDSVSTYLKLFILGDKEGLEEDIVKSSRKIGISHLFAVSGMHLSLIVMVIDKILKRLFLNVKIKNIIIVICLIVYNVITGFLISILRASLLSICLLKKGDNNFSRTDYLSFIMISFLIYNPYFIFNIGFILSFLISFSIILGSKLFKDDSKIIQVGKIGFLANLVSLPIIMNLNGSFGVLNIIYNILFVYFVTIVMLPGAFMIIVLPLNKIYLNFISLFEDLIEISSKFNYYLEFYFSFTWLRYLYFMLLLGFLSYYRTKKMKLFAIGLFLTVILVANYYTIFPSTFVRMIDVNQAEAIHIHHNTCDILIDTGKSDDYDTLINYFKNNNIKDIDYLVITHMHDDHYGEALDIINNFKVRSLIVNKTSSEFGLFPQIELGRGDYFGCGDIFLENLNYYHSDNENNNSLVLYGKIGLDYWLFTGDIESEIEDEIINNYDFSIDVLKVAHHGSSTSSSSRFLDRFKMDNAIISVGYNLYGHPSDSVLKRLDERNISVLRTDEAGTITFNYYTTLNLRIIDTYYYQKKRAYYF